MRQIVVETFDVVKTYHLSGRPGSQGGRIRNFFRAITGKGGPYITALDGVNFKVGRGEVFGLLGPNGAGKTTLLKVLSTLAWPDSGDACVNGFSVTKRPHAVLKNIQSVFTESRGFEWRLTARQNLAFFAGLYGLSKGKAEERMDFLLEFVGLKERQNDMLQKFSTGMIRRLQVCKALLIDVPILIFDEPTVGLDPISSSEFRELIKNKISREQGKTVLLSTHNMWEAEVLCDRVAIMHQGRVIACDTPMGIRRRVGGKSILTVSFHNSTQDANEEGILQSLLGIEGVIRASTDGPSHPNTLVVEVQRGIDFSRILAIIAASGLNVKSIVTSDPSLEEAFASLIE